jgi:hypothetical protein
MMYGSQILTKDVRIQLNGYVHVLIAHSMKSNLSSRHELLKAKEMMVCRSSLPLKCVGKHFCYNNMSIVNSLYSVFVHVLNPFQAVRVRFHYGTIQECIYNLMAYGISHNDIPIQYRTTNNSIGEGVSTTLDDDEFHIDTQFHIAFLEAIEEREEVDRLKQQQQSQQHQHQQQQQQQSQQQPQSQYSQQQSSQTEVQQQGMTNALDRNKSNGRGNSGGGSINNFNNSNNNSGGSSDGGITNDNNATMCVVIVPGPLDILMGRGCHNTNKPGTVHFKKLLETYRSQYDSTNSKNEKNAIVQTILQQVTDSGSRFLIQDTTTTTTTTTKTKTSSSSSNSSTSGSKNNNGNGNGKDGRWIISSHQKAYDKIAHDLRNMRRRRAVAAAAAATTTTITNTNN